MADISIAQQFWTVILCLFLVLRSFYLMSANLAGSFGVWQVLGPKSCSQAVLGIAQHWLYEL